MVQSSVHIAEYICVPYLKSILDGSEYRAYSRYICVPNLKSILDGSEYSAYSRYICVPNLNSILDGSEYSAYSTVHMCSKLKENSRWFRV